MSGSEHRHHSQLGSIYEARTSDKWIRNYIKWFNQHSICVLFGKTSHRAVSERSGAKWGDLVIDLQQENIQNVFFKDKIFCWKMIPEQMSGSQTWSLAAVLHSLVLDIGYRYIAKHNLWRLLRNFTDLVHIYSNPLKTPSMLTPSIYGISNISSAM